MPRIARVVVPRLPHHITQRGNYRQNIFSNDKDREKYLVFVQEYSQKCGASILAYCLMINHTHFVVIPKDEGSLAKTFNYAHAQYSKYYNWKRNVAGHLWQSRFYSCVLDEGHVIRTARYVERNPVRAGIVKEPWDWKWSSALEHSGKPGGNIIKLENLFDYINMNSKDWKHYIGSLEPSDDIDNVRKSTLTGRPLGSLSFIEDLEVKLDRKLHAIPRGRPAKIK